jgi:tetratricopeptide (TPR) repeat protein
MAAIAYGQFQKGYQVQHLSILVIISAVAGIFGSFGALLGFLLYSLFQMRAQHFNDWYESIFPVDKVTESQEIYDNIVEGLDENPRSYGVMPFLEVMRLGSEDQKRRALSKMTVRFNPRLAPAFKLALRDSSNAIRVQAATSVAKIERDFMTMLDKIKDARKLDPRNAQILLAQAKFYDDYAFTGVLDIELETANREQAITAYKAYLQHDPNHSESWLAVGRLLFRNAQWDEAGQWFAHALERGWKTNAMLMWYFECLYRAGKFAELRRAAREHGGDVAGQEDMPHNVRDAVAIWMRA